LHALAIVMVRPLHSGTTVTFGKRNR
jgi:hypothetical protein